MPDVFGRALALHAVGQAALQFRAVYRALCAAIRRATDAGVPVEDVVRVTELPVREVRVILQRRS